MFGGARSVDADAVLKKNFWIHLIEGATYLSSGVLLSPQTVLPALVDKLGGGNVAIGAIPIVVSLMYFLPQIVSANYIRSSPFRKGWTLRLGMLQRVQILLFAIIIGFLGLRSPGVTLAAFFVIYVVNQVFGGLGSPVWFDLVVKTTRSEDRGKLMGIRTSVGALMGFVNGFLLTVLLSYLMYPLNFAAVFGFAFLLQFLSWMVLRNVTELQPSDVESQVSLKQLILQVREIVQKDAVYRKFLCSAAFLIIGLMPMSFFMIAAIKEYSLDESWIGLFTTTMVGAQIFSAALLGWIADEKGHKVSLLVCSIATAAAIVVALLGGSPNRYFAVFFFVGINIGAETITRYNFVERCARDQDRPLYVGIMNGWLAPFYISATIGGYLCDKIGYAFVFLIGLVATLVGIILLIRLPDPSRPRVIQDVGI